MARSNQFSLVHGVHITLGGKGRGVQSGAHVPQSLAPWLAPCRHFILSDRALAQTPLLTSKEARYYAMR